MYSFIARQPIFDTKMQTVAYELLFRDGMNNAPMFHQNTPRQNDF
jgi:EAL and modified HD-GYP domain-containing signal transduction protein